MPTCQAYKCTNTTGRTAKGKRLFKIPEPNNAAERKKAQQLLHNIGMGQDIKTFKFSRNPVLCEDHFHKDCIKRNLMYGHFNMEPGKKELVERTVPTIFSRQIFDQINMPSMPTKVYTSQRTKENEMLRKITSK